MAEQDLLAVLDMSEDEQRKWVHFTLYDYYRGYTDSPLIQTEHILADLAFRLRSEVIKITDWWDACQLVYEYVAKEEFDKDKGWKSETGIWFQDFAKPIHWIIAALIAKGKENER